ncbi:hypothetical protein [Paenibacillus ginsengarvi]|uniref:Uncharacterized protein n=1 Tax=Paenibacillus ginsengarvi TaxID=400777 RepID=A0A3B0BDP8_9BACL|nr:hypothetical protein [Paenibacillus ginsengarvi]RKN70571.1 hypothetical protein D7M11_30345 [Paenibacillus ginsengarvi]
MSENKPQWYNDLKNGPIVSVSEPTLEIINDIERRVIRTRTSKAKKGLIWIPFALCLVVVLLTTGDFWMKNQGIISTHPPSDFEQVFDSNGDLIAMDKKWLMRSNTFEAYQAFSKNKTDEMLIGMEPLDILQIYAYASGKGDYETLYALFIQGYGIPSREDYLSDVAKDPGLQERSKSQWNYWKKMYRLKEEVNGNQVTVRMIAPDSSNISGPIFRLNKNDNGIWKVVWPLVQ